MTKLRLPISLPALLMSCFLHFSAAAQDKYELNIRAVDKDSAFLNSVGLQTNFASRAACVDYINKLPAVLQSKGFATSSFDSLSYDSLSASLVIFFGQTYQWAEIRIDSANSSLLSSIGWRAKSFSGKSMDFDKLQLWQNKVLDYLENNGHPFAKVYLDSLQILEDSKVSALLKIEPGPAYKIDSLRVFGNVKVSNNFLHHYLDI